MIQNFAHRGLKRFWERDDRSQVRADMADKIERILDALNSTKTVEALDLPSYALHALKGNLKGFWSITVRANWRIIFRFEGGNAYDVELIDYH